MQNLSENLKFKVIVWSPTRNLKWGDFKKKPDLKSLAAALSAIGFESEPLIAHFEAGGKFKFYFLDMKIQAIFIPGFSWVAKTLLKKDLKSLLNHEQGHFDLAEETVRKSKKETSNLFKKIFFVKGAKNKSLAKDKAIFQVTEIRKKIEDKLNRELKLEETLYDLKTNHGLIKLQQEKYDKRFKKLR